MSIYSILLYADKEGGDARGVGWQWARRGRGVGAASAMRYTVGNGKNGITHGRRWGLMRGFLPLVTVKTALPTVHPAAYYAVFYRW